MKVFWLFDVKIYKQHCSYKWRTNDWLQKLVEYVTLSLLKQKKVGHISRTNILSSTAKTFPTLPSVDIYSFERSHKIVKIDCSLADPLLTKVVLLSCILSNVFDYQISWFMVFWNILEIFKNGFVTLYSHFQGFKVQIDNTARWKKFPWWFWGRNFI